MKQTDAVEKEQILNIQKTLLEWFAKEGRELPWRKDYSPYHVWISEIMLQQTQMERGVDYFLRWIDRFPSVTAVAEADEQDILKHWEGLGYYARARNLHKSAKIIKSDFKGELPKSYKELLNLPGIGPYTASAVSSIAFNDDYPVIDANVERVYARLFNISGPLKEKETKKLIERLAMLLLPSGKARIFNQALMDFGALICSPRAPKCPECFFSFSCQALKHDVVSNRPVLVKKDKKILVEMVSGILVKNGRAFIQQRLENDVWGSLWEFPGGKVERGETLEDALVREFLEEIEVKISVDKTLVSITHFYTKYKVNLHCFICSTIEDDKKTLSPVLHAAQQSEWVTPDQLDHYGFSAGHRRVISFLEGQKFKSFWQD